MVKKKVFYMLVRQEIRKKRSSGQIWKGINLLGRFFFTDMTIDGIFKPDNKRHEELNEFLMTWNNRNVECQSECQIIISGSRWCTWRNISFANYSGFPKLRNWCRKRRHWCSRWCFRSDITAVEFVQIRFMELLESYVHIHSLIVLKIQRAEYSFMQMF